MARLPPPYRRLGYDTYADYLQSALWHRIRTRILQRDKCCIGCGLLDAPLHVHHRRYTLVVFDGRDDTGLVALCASCHNERHQARPLSEFEYDEFRVDEPVEDYRPHHVIAAEEDAKRTALWEAYLEKARAELRAEEAARWATYLEKTRTWTKAKTKKKKKTRRHNEPVAQQDRVQVS